MKSFAAGRTDAIQFARVLILGGFQLIRSTAQKIAVLTGTVALSFTLVTVPAQANGETVSPSPTTVTGCGAFGASPLLEAPVTGGGPEAVTVSPDGSRLYVSLTKIEEPGSGFVSVLDAATLQQVAEMRVPGHYPYAGKVYLNAAGTKGYLGTNSGTVQVFDALTNTMTASVPIFDSKAIAFSPDGAKVYVAGYNRVITVIDAKTDTVVDTWNFDLAYGTFVDIEIDPTGSFAYVGGLSRNVVHVIDLRSGAVVQTIEVGGPPGQLALTSDGKTLYVTDGFNGKLVVLDTATRSVRNSFSSRQGQQLLLSGSEDRAFLLSGLHSRIDVVDLTTDAVICAHSLLPDYRHGLMDFALSPDGRRMFVASIADKNNKISVLPIPEEENTLFRDVSGMDQFEREIRWMANAGIATGYEDGSYRPLEPVRRDAMAAFLYRFHGSPEFAAPAVSPFKDLNTTDKFYKEITWLASMGIATGWPDGTYRPLEPVQRDAMVAFMYRSVKNTHFSAPETSPYKDVRTTDQFYLEMAFMSANGVTTGWPDGTFRPLQPVNRDAMAAFMYRLNPLGPSNLLR
ncbi:S-layer homology domain-containing protein [Arthrobacter sp. UYP6]|uniref:S-layer homology domain-containing protein n=1 Tax=Arthrobacter sp. UYP6 TaxID=1756378 RepID=UPI0033966FEF